MADETQTTTEEKIDQTEVEAATETAQDEVSATEQVAEEVNDEAVADDAVVEEAASEEEAVTAESATSAIPDFRAGDTLRLGVRIKEGEKTRIQYFEGIVLARRGAGVNKSFTIRKIGAGGIAVERIFPLYSPALASFEIRRRGMTRRAKIYFLRDIVGSTANVIKERKVVRDHSQKKAIKSQKKADKAAKKAETAKVKSTKATGSRSAKRAAKKSS